MCNKAVIECISKYNYLQLKKFVEYYLNYALDKEIVIFGAGIIGMQLMEIFNVFGVYEVVFYDNNSEKWGLKIKNSTISPPKLFENNKNKFIFITMENYYECEQQIRDAGYIENESYCIPLKNYYNEYESIWNTNSNSELLILGDCFLKNVSLLEENKTSLEELLIAGAANVVAIEGIYIRSYYNLLMLKYAENPKLKKVAILLDISILRNNYDKHPANQHKKIFEVFYSNANNKIQEFEEFLNILDEREKAQFLLNDISPRRIGSISPEKELLNMKLHMQLNYLFELDEESEELIYFEKILDFCKINNILIDIVLIPINYEYGEYFFGKTFNKRYERTLSKIKNIVNKKNGNILDLSNLLTQNYFIHLKSANEGLKYSGRKYVSEKILSNLKKGSYSERINKFDFDLLQ